MNWVVAAVSVKEEFQFQKRTSDKKLLHIHKRNSRQNAIGKTHRCT